MERRVARKCLVGDRFTHHPHRTENDANALHFWGCDAHRMTDMQKWHQHTHKHTIFDMQPQNRSDVASLVGAYEMADGRCISKHDMLMLTTWYSFQSILSSIVNWRHVPAIERKCWEHTHTHHTTHTHNTKGILNIVQNYLTHIRWQKHIVVQSFN